MKLPETSELAKKMSRCRHKGKKIKTLQLRVVTLGIPNGNMRGFINGKRVSLKEIDRIHAKMGIETKFSK
jgi:hypothetical protein